MEWIHKEVIEVFYLVPRFAAVRVFHDLKPHRKQILFERAVCALIVVSVDQVIVAGVPTAAFSF